MSDPNLRANPIYGPSSFRRRKSFVASFSHQRKTEVTIRSVLSSSPYLFDIIYCCDPDHPEQICLNGRRCHTDGLIFAQLYDFPFARRYELVSALPDAVLSLSCLTSLSLFYFVNFSLARRFVRVLQFRGHCFTCSTLWPRFYITIWSCLWIISWYLSYLVDQYPPDRGIVDTKELFILLPHHSDCLNIMILFVLCLSHRFLSLPHKVVLHSDSSAIGISLYI